MTPEISVIIPTYNNAQFLKDSITSVKNQSYENIEIIVVNDGSTDHTEQVIADIDVNLKYYVIDHSGAASARNFGVQKSSGEYIAFLDADDLWPQEKIQRQLACITSQNIDAVFTGIKQFLDDSFKSGSLKSNAVVPGISLTTMMIAREKFLNIGLLKTSFQLGEFVEWFIRSKQFNLRYEVLMDVVTQRRIHGNNTTAKNRANKKDYLHAINQAITVSA